MHRGGRDERRAVYRLAGCVGKVRFGDPAIARRAARRQKGGRRRLVAYRCRFCEGWHVGALPPKGGT